MSVRFRSVAQTVAIILERTNFDRRLSSIFIRSTTPIDMYRRTRTNTRSIAHHAHATVCSRRRTHQGAQRSWGWRRRARRRTRRARHTCDSLMLFSNRVSSSVFAYQLLNVLSWRFVSDLPKFKSTSEYSTWGDLGRFGLVNDGKVRRSCSSSARRREVALMMEIRGLLAIILRERVIWRFLLKLRAGTRYTKANQPASQKQVPS